MSLKRGPALLAMLAAVVTTVVLRACVDQPSAPPVTPPPPPPPPPVANDSAVLVGAGDIARCGEPDHDSAVAVLLDSIPGTVMAVGDNAYANGTLAEFTACYGPTWGRFKARTRPAAGNHEYNTPGAAGYYAYFGAAAGHPDEGWYSYDLGFWHIVVLNSNRAYIDMEAQLAWLRADLRASTTRCTLAYWHFPRFSSGEHGSMVQMDSAFRALYDAGADVVISGHDHDYERFAPQTPDGMLDRAAGIRQFVVGTGDGALYDFRALQPNSEVRNAETFGVLRLALGRAGYSWRFIAAEGKTFTDTGSDQCH